uniref:Uncharacterized protein n=1 Tax=Arundo donax TaxID=35708 RepID=A0A0A9ATQ3_ARUDO
MCLNSHCPSLIPRSYYATNS